MSLGRELLREHRYRELWQHYCGFIDLTLPQFMGVQGHLLLEQLELLKRSELGRWVMRGSRPSTVEEFRQGVPLTTYADYAPYLGEQREEVLPARPLLWQRTNGVSGEFEFKWAPITPQMYQAMGPVLFAVLIFATCRWKGDISFGSQEDMFYALAPPPFATGCWAHLASQELPVRFLPPLTEAERLSFQERLAQGLSLGLDQGIDLVFGLPSVLVALGEEIGRRSAGERPLAWVLRPRALARLLKARIKSGLLGRPVRPRDLWSLRGVAIAGKDAALYRTQVRELWGKEPLEVYGCTEGMVLAMQTWDYQGLTFVPHLNFLEFIPEEELRRESARPGYRPSTVLLDEVRAGGRYEVVITNLWGGAFVRYRLGDVITIDALEDQRLGIRLPQMSFYARSDSIIDLAGFTRLTERTLGQAIELAGVPCVDWIACKEARTPPVLHLYLELRESNGHTAGKVESLVHEQLKRLDAPYADLERLLGLQPLRLTVLAPGSFGRVSLERSSARARHGLRRINPPQALVQALLNGTGAPQPLAERPVP
ncbi:MAG: GH3 auxin-responsive promoter family protein [Chloroflexi bacterium]|nr:GH3 auxin-responsive promoter family protein [Chloroflexota bacterium]